MTLLYNFLDSINMSMYGVFLFGEEGKLLYPVFLLIKNPINSLRLHQFLGTKTTEMNKSLKTDANGAN